MPAHIIKEKQRRDRASRYRDEMARIPMERPCEPMGPRGRVEGPKGEKKRPGFISIEL